jgi:hypothetical protein
MLSVQRAPEALKGYDVVVLTTALDGTGQKALRPFRYEPTAPPNHDLWYDTGSWNDLEAMTGSKATAALRNYETDDEC